MILERFADNPFLPKFYKDPERYAFTLEMSFLSERYQQISEDLSQLNLFNELIVSDYDIHKSLIFSKVNLNISQIQSDPINIIYKLIGDQQMYKKLERLMKSKRYNKEISDLRKHRTSSEPLSRDRIKLQTQKLPVIQEINRIVKNAQKAAELKYAMDNKIVELMNRDQNLINHMMKVGNIKGAQEIQQQNLESQNLLNMAK